VTRLSTVVTVSTAATSARSTAASAAATTAATRSTGLALAGKMSRLSAGEAFTHLDFVVPFLVLTTDLFSLDTATNHAHPQTPPLKSNKQQNESSGSAA
jgi:hypothetical protein